MTFESVQNFREMGGLPVTGDGTVRPGRLFRSGHWSQATEQDVATLASYDLAAVIDFRAEVDRDADGGPDRLPDEPEYVQLPMVDVDGVGNELRTTLMSGDQELLHERFGNGRAEQLASEFVTKMALGRPQQQVFARFLQTVLTATDQDRPVLWHCSAGKDRAGWASTLIGMALGVPDDALAEHYVASNIHRPVEGRLAYYAERGVDASIMRPFLMVHERYLRDGLAAVDDGWQSRAHYLEDALGLGRDQVTLLRERLVV